MLRLLCFLAVFVPITAFSINDNNVAAKTTVSRRESFAKFGGAVAAATAVLTNSPASSFATVTDETPKVTTQMGGYLEKYQDSRGWTIMAPSGWNKFDGEVGAYDLKWQDIVNTDEIKVSSTPVKSTTTSV